MAFFYGDESQALKGLKNSCEQIVDNFVLFGF